MAQVVGAANTASQKAKDAQSAADRAEGAAGEAQKAKAAAADSVQQAKGEAESAQTAAQQADKAAARAEGYAPKDGTVLSVNGKGGAVRLNAADVGAMAADKGDLVQQVVLEGRTLTVVFTDGTQQAYTTQDTTELTAMTGVLRTANGGTAEGAMPAPATPAWEALVGMLGTGGITTAEKRAVLTMLRTLAAGNDAAACDRLEALWGADDPDNRNTARLSLAVLGRMILGRS